MPLLTPTPISPLFIMEMPGRKDARTPEKLRTCIASNLFVGPRPEAVLVIVQILSKILHCLFGFLLMQDPCQKSEKKITHVISIGCVFGTLGMLRFADKNCQNSTQNSRHFPHFVDYFKAEFWFCPISSLEDREKARAGRPASTYSSLLGNKLIKTPSCGKILR